MTNLLAKQTFSIQSPNTRSGNSTLRNANNERGLAKHVVTKQLYLYVYSPFRKHQTPAKQTLLILKKATFR
jgi:hypothetical protein